MKRRKFSKKKDINTCAIKKEACEAVVDLSKNESNSE